MVYLRSSVGRYVRQKSTSGKKGGGVSEISPYVGSCGRERRKLRQEAPADAGEQLVRQTCRSRQTHRLAPYELCNWENSPFCEPRPPLLASLTSAYLSLCLALPVTR